MLSFWYLLSDSWHIQVSEDGDILYVLPQDFKARLRNRSLMLRLEPAFKGIRAAASYLTRISFGTALIASVTLVWVAILAIQSGSGNRDDNRHALSHPCCFAVVSNATCAAS